MRNHATRLLVAAVICLALPAQADARPTTNTNANPSSDCSTVKYHNYLTRSWFNYSVKGGVDYHAREVSKRERIDLASIRSCLKRNDPAKYKLARGAYEKVSEKWRFHRRIDRITVYGAWAIPPQIVDRESGGDCTAKNPKSSAGGCYQFIDSTWYSYGGSGPNGCYHVAACAPVWEQHIIAHRAWNDPGTRHWALTDY